MINMTSIIANFSVNIEDISLINEVKSRARNQQKTFSKYVVDVLKKHVMECSK
jgi:hypothetical protein